MIHSVELQSQLEKKNAETQQELEKRDTELNDLRRTQQSLQKKYGELEQQYENCLRDSMEMKRRCEEKEQVIAQVMILQGRITKLEEENATLKSECE